MDTQQWWDALDPDTRDVVARRPRGPLDPSVLDEVTASVRAWSATWENDLLRRDGDTWFLSDELAEFVETDNAGLRQRLRETAADDDTESDDADRAALDADEAHARARGLS